MSAHSVLAPSGSHVWGAPDGCLGWVLMSQRYREREPTPDSLAGDACHEVAAELVRKTADYVNYSEDDYVGHAASNGVLIDEEMFEAACLYADDIGEVMDLTGVRSGRALGIEQKLNIPMIHDVCFGTPDCFLFDFANRVLYLWDFKYGHRWVDEFRNWQLICYFAGLFSYFKMDGAFDQHLTVKFRIVQPRAYGKGGPVREWSVNGAELRGPINQLRAAAQAALSGRMEFTSGPHCRDCPGRHACPSADEAGFALYEAVNAPLPLDATPAQLGTRLMFVERAIGALEALKTGMEAEAEHHLRNGKQVNGYGMTPTYGRETWAKPLSQVVAMGDLAHVNLRKEGALTPNQARQKGLDESIIKAFSHKPKTGIKLTADTANRVKRVFS